jgi:hypothetical protein
VYDTPARPDLGGVIMPHSATNVRELRFGRSFDSIDMDHDAVTTLEDWEEFACYLCDQFDESIDSPSGRQMREAVLNWWYRILGRLDSADDRQLTRAKFATYYGNGTEEELGAVIRRYIDAIFALCDGDADDCLSRRELAAVLRVHGVPERALTQTMRCIVADRGDGISKEKYTNLVLEYCLGTRSSGG